MLDPTICYAAVRSRDPRFDGRFYTGVLTTGIYCRPICPARTPLEKNVRFFRCAAEAEEAGLRPCLRCRPETAPGSAAWMATSATVARALRLIDGGALDGGGVSDLASRLGVGERQLRRLFVEHVGASPASVAQLRRVRFAKTLIDQTELPMSEIAFTAGFGSVRRFNDAFKSSYQRAPSEIRRAGAQAQGDDAQLTLMIRARPPFDASPAIAYLGARAIPGVEEVRGGWYRRLIPLEGGGAGVVEVGPMPSGAGLMVRAPAGVGRGLMAVAHSVRRLFDTDADPQIITAHLAADALLAPCVAARPGLRAPGAYDPFEAAVRVIVGQQVSVSGATTIIGRIVARFGTAAPDADGQRGGGLTHLFPSPQRLCEAPVEEAGMPRQRAGAIRGLAAAVASGELTLDGALDLDDAVERLLALKGVGPWTAHMIALRALGEPDAFPAGDLIIRRQVSPEGQTLTEKQVTERAATWRPWRAYAAMHLWAAYNTAAEERKKQ